MEDHIFSTPDREQLKAQDIPMRKIEQQLQLFQQGIPFVDLVSAAKIGNGILAFDDSTRRKYIKLYNDSSLEPLKFVPASGAASRMFKSLHEFVKGFNPSEDNLEQFLQQSEYQNLQAFFSEIENFAFYPESFQAFQQKFPKYQEWSVDRILFEYVQFLLKKSGLDYENLPKGLVPFHRYGKDYAVTAFEEHLMEAATYASRNGEADIHFTVTEDSLEKFKNTFAEIRERVEAETKMTYNISYSFQKKSTDTLAVNFQNQPFRGEEGKLILRPGGHGALLENLNELDADVIFVKNIDNVVTGENLAEITDYKKMLAGVLLSVQKQIADILNIIDEGKFSEETLRQANNLRREYFSIKTEMKSATEVKTFLNTPIRICGMVENQGAPGGGPFWVKDEKGTISLQIVEGAQIDNDNAIQHQISQDATHFNPVDLVCGVRDYQGNKFDLTHFVNPKEGFISKKSKNGQNLKALELPGLWNGGMAFWNTIFVEVPLITFNPVKTVIDLLKPSHQPKLQRDE